MMENHIYYLYKNYKEKCFTKTLNETYENS